MCLCVPGHAIFPCANTERPHIFTPLPLQPLRSTFSDDRDEMREQLEAAWPIHTCERVLHALPACPPLRLQRQATGDTPSPPPTRPTLADPQLVLLPDGGVAVAAGKLLVRWVCVCWMVLWRQGRALTTQKLTPALPPRPLLLLQQKYARTGPSTFEREFKYTDRPGAPWSYPQTGP